jgi:hypothetical protein
MAQEGYNTARSPSATYLGSIAATNLRSIYNELGSITLLMSLVGIGMTTLVPLWRRQRIAPVWAVSLAVLIGVMLFHNLLVPLRDSRHLIPAFGLLGVFAAAAAACTAGLWPGGKRTERAATLIALLTLVAGAFGAQGFSLVPKASYGAAELALFLTRTAPPDATIVVGSPDALGEGAVIAEVALLEPEPRIRILRASKLFASTQWDGRNYRLRVTDEQRALQVMEQQNVQMVVLARYAEAASPTPHWRVLESAVASRPERLERLPLNPADSRYEVYRLKGPLNRTPEPPRGGHKSPA